MVEMHISEIGFCSGHSASGIWTDEHARTSIPGLYAAGDCGSVPHNYMLGAFVYGAIAGEDAAEYCLSHEHDDIDSAEIATEKERVLAPTKIEDGVTPEQLEYKLRRLVNDYLQPPKVTRKMEIGMERFAEIRNDLSRLKANDPHELMRAMEVKFILDCAEMAAVSSMYRTESRWGLYHYRVDYPETDNNEWYCHVQTFKGEDGKPSCKKREVEPYIVELDDDEKGAYNKLRIEKASAEA
jgi:succinate dehydrogenase/fumarate reductase flavoprotein subunit